MNAENGKSQRTEVNVEMENHKEQRDAQQEKKRENGPTEAEKNTQKRET